MATAMSSTAILPDSTIAEWAVRARSPSYSAPGKWIPKSTKSQPATASMQIRLCLSSASRIHVSVCGPLFENPSGSKPTSPAIEPSSAAGASRKGSDGDLAIICSPPPRVGGRTIALPTEKAVTAAV